MSKVIDEINAMGAGCMECGGPKEAAWGKLLAHTRALEAMLKRLEFSAKGQDMGASWKTCPMCFAYPGLPHAPMVHRDDCALAKLLEGVEE